MNNTKAKPSTGEGWAIHVYDRDRHLRFTLEPSHIWAFSWGMGVALFASILWSVLYSASHSCSSNTKPLTNPAETSETTSREAFRTEPTSSFHFGID